MVKNTDTISFEGIQQADPQIDLLHIHSYVIHIINTASFFAFK